MNAASNEYDLDLQFEDELIASASGPENKDEEKFDLIIGELEDILMDDEFLCLQTNFMTKYSDVFSNEQENKLEYTEIFEQYTGRIEQYISIRLATKLDWFSMHEFMEMLSRRNADDLQGDVFDLLDTLGDFAAFKDLMLSYKNGPDMDLSSLLSVTRA